MTIREAATELLRLHDWKAHGSAAEQAAWTALRESVATVEEFNTMGTGVTVIRELQAQIAATDSRVCAECGQIRKRERTGRVL